MFLRERCEVQEGAEGQPVPEGEWEQPASAQEQAQLVAAEERRPQALHPPLVLEQ